MEGRQKWYRILKGIFRIQIGLALFRIWSLDRIRPRKINLHLFDAGRKAGDKAS